MLSTLRRLSAGVTVASLLAGAQAAAGGAAPAPTSTIRTYQVARGETLSAVATKLRVDMAALVRANGIVDVHRIRAGDLLVVPARAATKAETKDQGSRQDRLPARLRERPDRLALLATFDAAARRHGVPAELLKALTWLESGWQNDKVSSTKALGIGQLMPDTVDFVNDRLLKAKLDPRRPVDNIAMSASFLAYLLRRSDGDVAMAVASYYQGLASVQRHGPGGATRRYVADVLALRRNF
ncbi:MAG: lytic transglycosylase domain-containing protein [Acidimicrobiales bacterium]